MVGSLFSLLCLSSFPFLSLLIFPWRALGVLLRGSRLDPNARENDRSG